MVKTTPSGGSGMEYVRPVGEGNSVSYFRRRGIPTSTFKKKVIRTMPVRIVRSEAVANLAWSYGRQGVISFMQNTNFELDTMTDYVTADPTSKLLMQSTKVHYMLTNGSKVGVRLRIYEGCAKRDVASSQTPQAVWAQGLLDVGTTEALNNIDAKPFTSPLS